jgi:hypothetical protein
VLLLAVAALLAAVAGPLSIPAVSPAPAAAAAAPGDEPPRPCVFGSCTATTTPGGYQYVYVNGTLRRVPATVDLGGKALTYVPACQGDACYGPGDFCALATQLAGFLIDPNGVVPNQAACAAPAAPALDLAAVEAQLTAYLRDRALPRPTVKVQPTGRTFTNLPTIFYLPNPATFTLPVNQPVAATITAAPHYRWNFGDGTSGGDSPGRPYNPSVSPRDDPGYYVSHLYAKPGTYRVTLTVTWQGTFTVAGAAQAFPIGAVNLAAGAPVVVQEAAGVLTGYND